MELEKDINISSQSDDKKTADFCQMPEIKDFEKLVCLAKSPIHKQSFQEINTIRSMDRVDRILSKLKEIAPIESTTYSLLKGQTTNDSLEKAKEFFSHSLNSGYYVEFNIRGKGLELFSKISSTEILEDRGRLERLFNRKISDSEATYHKVLSKGKNSFGRIVFGEAFINPSGIEYKYNSIKNELGINFRESLSTFMSSIAGNEISSRVLSIMGFSQMNPKYYDLNWSNVNSGIGGFSINSSNQVREFISDAASTGSTNEVLRIFLIYTSLLVKENHELGSSKDIEFIIPNNYTYSYSLNFLFSKLLQELPSTKDDFSSLLLQTQEIQESNLPEVQKDVQKTSLHNNFVREFFKKLQESGSIEKIKESYLIEGQRLLSEVERKL